MIDKPGQISDVSGQGGVSRPEPSPKSRPEAEAKTEMVERVARAIGIAAKATGMRDGVWFAEEQRELACKIARAAIEAMFEPTDEMAEAGFQHTGDPCWQDDVKNAWRAMISAALSQQKAG